MHQTGVPNLDIVLGGGIPEGDILLVVGPAGSGKTVLSFQMAFHVASQGRNALYVSTLSEPPNRLIQHVRPFAFLDESLVGKHLFLLSVYPLVKESLSRVAEALAGAVRERQAELVVLDGLMTLRDLHPQAPELRTFVYELGATLSALGCTTVVTSSATEEAAGRPLPEATMADGILILDRLNIGTQTVRTVRSRKMRGLPNLLGLHSMRIDRQGITVFPRIESVPMPLDLGIDPERVPLGLPELDTMLSGGLPVGSVTLLAGALGTGKTLGCLHFVLEGAKRGEKSLFVGFRETPRQLFDKARAFGLDLEGAVRSGQVEILYRSPVDLNVDEAIWELLDNVERARPRRLALDGVAELEQGILEERRKRGVMTSLAGLLRGRGATSLLTKEIAQVVGPELDFSDTPLAALAENLLLLRYVEFRGELFRILSILKMRDSPHDHTIRQYTITEQGFRVLTRLETAEGVLTGIARLPSEVRVKRRPGREGELAT